MIEAPARYQLALIETVKLLEKTVHVTSEVPVMFFQPNETHNRLVGK